MSSQLAARVGTSASCESLDHQIAVQEVVLHELAEPGADLGLASRHDRRVRDRDAERVPEQGRDGEPIGERTDHRRLGERLDVADRAVAVAERAGQDVHDRRGQEQSGGDELHVPQAGSAFARRS